MNRMGDESLERAEEHPPVTLWGAFVQPIVEQARLANSPERWNALWKEEGDQSWRKEALGLVYQRIEALLPRGVPVSDVGGGIGLLAQLLLSKASRVTVWDQTEEILLEAMKADPDHRIGGFVVDLEEADLEEVDPGQGEVVVATEVLEHLSPWARHEVLTYAARAGRGFFSVPNDRLGPDEEPQHTIKFNAMSFKRELKRYFKDVRVEVHGAYLLGVCGFPKNFTLSVCMPVRDEAADLERTLASFRGVADQLVVGVDPRTKDKTYELAEKYADEVFYFVDPEGPKPGVAYAGARTRLMALNEKRVPEGGVHFSWIRNQCMDHCTGDWIFMTEGHERLVEGQDALLHLGQVPEGAKIGLVWRSDTFNQRWAFPWLCRNHQSLLYERSTHNSLCFPEGTLVVRLREIRTLHDRVHTRSKERAKQRKIQNRVTLMDDWMTRGSEFSKYYLASEWREFDTERSEQHWRELLAMPSKNGPLRYQARLILSKMLWLKQDIEGARETLMGCANEDWSRTEHWIWLGDIAASQGNHEEAVQFYLYGTTRLNDPPFTTWWFDMAYYSNLPAQRLAMSYGELGNGERALYWAQQALVLLPPESPDILFEEARSNISILEEALHATAA